MVDSRRTGTHSTLRRITTCTPQLPRRTLVADPLAIFAHDSLHLHMALLAVPPLAPSLVVSVHHAIPPLVHTPIKRMRVADMCRAAV